MSGPAAIRSLADSLAGAKSTAQAVLDLCPADAGCLGTLEEAVRLLGMAQDDLDRLANARGEGP